MDGWIKIHRKLRDNPIYKNSVAVHCWIECLMRATHKEYEVLIGREKIPLKPGQFVMGRKEFAKEINVSPSTAWFWLHQFKVDSMIDIKSTNKYSVVTILNWDEYQDIDIKLDSKKTTDEQQMNTYKNDKNDKNILSKDNIVRKKPDAGIDFILSEFYKYANHRPIDRSPRNVAHVFKRQIIRLIKDVEPYKKLTFEGVVRSSFEWYREKNEDAQARYLNTVRKNVTEILFESTRRKYIKNLSSTYDKQE